MQISFKYKENVENLLDKAEKSRRELAFATIVKNRVFHGGILANGSGLMKKGENGKGLGSRWYPTTICRRINAIHTVKSRFEFHKKDGFSVIEQYKDDDHYTFFLDPPYTVAGKRLYNLSNIDHCKLFELVSQIRGHYLLTYDNCAEIKNLVKEHNLNYRTIPMMTTHLVRKEELIISDDFSWLN